MTLLILKMHIIFRLNQLFFSINNVAKFKLSSFSIFSIPNNFNSSCQRQITWTTMFSSSAHPSEELLRTTLPPHVTANQLEPLKCYHEQNPDLITGTESIERTEYDMVMRSHQLISKNPPFNLQTIKEGDCNLPPFVMQGDLRLNPVSLMNTGSSRTQNYSHNCYRTLPNKRRTAAVPIGKF